jgi:type IV pilus assembly protein PilQ
MRKAFRGTATATALALAWAAAAGCSSGRQGTHDAADTVAATTPAPAPAAAPVSVKITQAAINEDADGARLVLSATAPLLYTSYEPRPDLLVVDLRGAVVAEGFQAPRASGGIVSAIKFEELDELGKRVTRLSVTHRADARVDVRSVGQGLAVAVSEPAPDAGAEEAAEADGADEPTKTADASAVSSAPIEAPATPAPAPVAAAPTPSPVVPSSPSAAVPVAARGEVAHVLEKIVAENRDGHVAVTLIGDGWFAAKDFVLANPPRIVVDLPGVKNEVRQRTIPVQDGLVSRVRVSQFQTSPELVTRVVVDLNRPAAHSVVSDGERLAVLVGVAPAVAGDPPRAEASPVPSAAAEEPPVTVAAAPAPASVESRASESSPIAAPSEATLSGAPAPVEAPPPQPAVAERAPAPVETRVVDPPASAAAASAETAPVAEAHPVAQPRGSSDPAPASTVAISPPPASAPAPPPAAAAPAPAASTASARPAPRSGKAAPSRSDALFEAAAATLDQEQASQSSGASYRSRTISETPTQFTGEPISLDLKDADIKDVFRTISQLTGLNIVIDPEVRGTVTVQLEDVPWDQALDLILKQNGLGYVLENNIMRIATTAKLQAEEADRARLAEARQAAEPTRTVIKKLSYAKAAEIVPTLQSVMSKRGAIVVDQRTNTLIIREIPTYLPAVLQLIDNLDTATPQVVIESRIVETTKTLGRSLGINWSVRGKADTSTGNTTNLIFPNNIAGGINVGLGNGPTVASLVMGNILNTFNLDVALTAAENQGLLKIISSPKVTSLTNTPALIQSGVQIPVQTTVNNTTTVIYVDATLKLDVTPQITAEGTILLTVNVTKREPAVALNLSLGQNVPLSIREYRGQVLVKDGGTTVIGGIFQINDQDQNNMIPGLWKIPVLGNLFRNKTRTEKHDELLIFITPRILRS